MLESILIQNFYQEIIQDMCCKVRKNIYSLSADGLYFVTALKRYKAGCLKWFTGW
jgi:hypothetical protein